MESSFSLSTKDFWSFIVKTQELYGAILKPSNQLFLFSSNVVVLWSSRNLSCSLTLHTEFRFSHFSFSVSLSVFLLALTSSLGCRSSGSSEFWRSLSLHSQVWSFLHGWAQARPPHRERGTREKSHHKRGRLHLQPEIPFPMTASLQLGPMKSVSHDLRNSFLECWHSCLKW